MVTNLPQPEPPCPCQGLNLDSPIPTQVATGEKLRKLILRGTLFKTVGRWAEGLASEVTHARNGGGLIEG